MSFKIGVWSANFDVINGQALVTKYVVEDVLPTIGNVRSYIFQSGFGFVALLTWTKACFKLLFHVIFRRVDTLYLVCSRSSFGFIRDMPALSAALLGVRVVIHAHGSDVIDLLSRKPVSWIARRLFLRCELIVSSSHQKTQLKSYVKNIVSIDNFISKDIEHDQMRPNAETTLNILWTSNIIVSKGFFELMQAVETVNSTGADVKVTSLGRVILQSGESQSEIFGKFEEVKASNWFTYLGQVSQDTSIEFLHRADVVALPSYFEAQPLAIIEAMCAGRAIIITDIVELLETVGTYPCEVVGRKSVSDLVASLLRLRAEKFADPVQFFDRRIVHAQKAKQRFSKQRFASELKSMLQGDGS